jgi:hypothetical protein
MGIGKVPLMVTVLVLVTVLSTTVASLAVSVVVSVTRIGIVRMTVFVGISISIVVLSFRNMSGRAVADILVGGVVIVMLVTLPKLPMVLISPLGVMLVKLPLVTANPSGGGT